MDHEPMLGNISLAELADFRREHLTIEVEVFEEPYGDGYVVTRVTASLGDTTIARGSDGHRYG